jgi:hypothetical protein
MAQTVSSIGVCRVGPVAIHQVDEVQAHARERAVDGLHQVLAVERVLAVRGVAFAVQAPEELGRHDVVQARPFQRLDGLAHHDLALAAGIGLGVVEEVHAGAHGFSEHLAGCGRVDLVVVGHPGAQREFADLQAAAAETSILHGKFLVEGECVAKVTG